MTREADQVLADLGALGPEIREHEQALAKLYPRRLALFQEGRAMDPPIVNRLLGEAVGCEETAVTAALRKAKAKADATGT